jgi:hypothetical protein
MRNAARALGPPADSPRTGHDDLAVGKRLLFADAVVLPAGGVELRQNVLTTRIGFGEARS